MNSIWLSEKKQNNQYNQLAEDKTTDVCIIGAGIFGITCGYYLAKAGLKVTIIEKDELSLPWNLRQASGQFHLKWREKEWHKQK